MAEMSESRGLWKYMILLGAFIVNFLSTGTAKSFGVLIPTLKHEFDTRVSILGFGIGMCHGLAVGLTFLSHPLLTKVTCRALTMIGGLVAGVGLCICSFSGTAVLFIIGIAIGGFGYSFMIISNVVIVKDYFTGSYSMALSFNFTGGAVGMMLIPAMTEKLAVVYGWRGALLLVAALNFQNVAVGALYRPLEQNTLRTTCSALSEENYAAVHEMSDSAEGAFLRGTLESTKDTMRGTKYQHMGDWSSSNESKRGCKETEKALTKTHQYQEHENMSGFEKRTRAKEKYKQRKSLISSDSEDEISNNNKVVAKWALKTPADNHDSERESGLDKEQSNKTTNDRSRTSCTADIFNLRLMCDFPAINLVMIAALLSGATTTGWVAFLVPNGQIKGYLMNKAVLLATIGGFGNIFGRFFIGFTIGPRITARALFIVCNLICGVAFCLNYVTTTFWALSILSTINGSTIGAMTVLVCLMIEEIVDESRYASGVALAYFFLGLGEIFGGLFAGWIYDMTHTYDISFIGLGCLNFLAALLTLLALSSCSRCSFPPIYARNKYCQWFGKN